jgi:4'-phosphopantetheinyl transferase
MPDVSLPVLALRAVAAAPPLGDSDLHLWRIELGAGGGDPRDLLAELDPNEQARAERLAVASRRDAFVRAHAGLRRILALYLADAASAIGLRVGRNGKPYLAGDPPPLHFNLTTAADLALLGVARSMPLGVDCERLAPRSNLAGIARRMFPPEVADAVLASPEPDRLTRFYRAWTALEAEVKADGRGLHQHRRRNPGAAPTIHHCIPKTGYLAAIAGIGLGEAQGWTYLRLE